VAYVFDDAFDDVFATEYESFLIDDELEYDVFEFDDLCSTTNCLLIAISKYVTESISHVSFEFLTLLSMHF